MAISRLLVNGSLSEILELARNLGSCRQELAFSEFQATLFDLRMGAEEILGYWNAIDVRACKSGCSFESGNDTQLSTTCGILLDTKKFSRNLLLYRLVELKFPGLLSVSIKTVPHKGKVLSGRWEYAGEGKRNVLVLRFPSAEQERPKKSRLRRRRSRWRDERHSMLDRW